MANIKITELAELTSATSNDLLPIVDVSAGATKNVKPGNLVIAGAKELARGTQAAPAVAFGGAADANTGIYSPGADQVAISTNGTGRLFVDADGRVGVGNIAPQYQLDLNQTGTNTLFNAGINAELDAADLALKLTTWGNTGGRSGSVRFITGSSTGGSERLRITSNGELKHIGGGSVGDPAVYFAGSAPAKSLYVEAATGHVGLGTSAPGTLLHARITSSAEWTSSENLSGSTNIQNAILNLTNSSDAITGTESTLLFNAGSSGGAQHSITCKRTSATVGDLIFRTRSGGGATSSELMRLTGSGRLGVGTTAPSETLTVSSDSANVAKIRLNRSNTLTSTGLTLSIAGNSGRVSADQALEYTGTSHIFFNSDASAERARIDSFGRLLVGTSSALSADSEAGTGATDGWGLQLSGTNTPSSIGLFNYSNSDVDSRPNQLVFARSRGAEFTQTLLGNDDAIGAVSFQGSDGAKFVRAAAIRCEVDGTPGTDDMPGRLVFSTNGGAPDTSPTERMRISNDGHTYWGVANPGTAAFGTSMGRAGNPGLFENYRDGTATTTACNLGGPLGNVIVKCDGDLENTNNSYTGISDVKLKENIVDAGSQWDDLKAIRVRKYNFKEETGYNTHTQIGLVAQEVELVSPGLVGETVNDDTGEVTKNVAYSVLYMKAVKALQEAMERIETLEASNADLLARVSALEAN